MWWLYSLLANASVLTSEYLFRARMFQSFMAGWWVFLPLSLLSSLALFYAFSGAPRYLVAWGMFFSMNMVGRVGVSILVLHEPLPLLTLAGTGVIIVGAVLVRV